MIYMIFKRIFAQEKKREVTYYKPNLALLPQKSKKEIWEMIMNTEVPDDTNLVKEAKEQEKKILKKMYRNSAQKGEI